MSIPDNLIEAAWTTLVQARGLDKLHRPAILEVTAPDIKQTLNHAWGLDKLVTLLLVKATTSDIKQSSTLDNLFRPQAGSELRGLMYSPGSIKYT